MKVLMPFWNLRLFHRYKPQIEAIANKCEEFTIIYLDGEVFIDPYIAPHIKFKKVSLSKHPSYLKWIFGISKMWGEIRDIEVDIYYCLSGLWMQLAVWHFSEKSGKPYVIRLRGDDLATRKNTKQGWLKIGVFEKINKVTFNDADLIIPISMKMLEVVNRYKVDWEKVSKVVHNGIDGTLFDYTNYLHDHFTVGFVGRISIEKGSVLLNRLIAFMLYAEHIKFRVVGEIQDTLTHQDNLDYVGIIPYKDIGEFYKSIDVLILPSLNEGFPNTILEAYLSGKPVIASKNAYPPELPLFGYVLENKGNNFDLVNWNRAIEMIRKSRRSDPNYYKEAKEISEYVKNNFSWEKYGKEFIELFKSII